MGPISVGLHVADKLGPEATEDLAHAFEELRDEVLAVADDRFGVRVGLVASELRHEMARMDGNLRQEMARMDGNLRQDMAKMDGNLRQDMAKMDANLRQDMTKMDANLRVSMADGFASIRKEMAEMRVELIRTSFLFWLGQFVAILAALGYMLRGVAR
jgi:hypothetical protein